MTESLSVDQLAAHCAEETARYRRGESHAERYCFELFRRAVALRDERAWAAVYETYAEVVRRWVGTRMDPDEGVPLAFERFWRAIDAEKFRRFGSLAALLQYLKMCVHTAVLDRARAAAAVAVEQPIDDAMALPGADDVERSVGQRLDTAAFWRLIGRLLDDEREQRLLYLSYAIGLSPREICARHGDLFPDVREIYRIKRNALERLRRAPELRTVP